MSLLVRIAQVVDHVENWMESCPCHYKDEGAIGSKVFSTRSSCKMAGRRAPELAAGALDVLVQDCFQAQQLELAVACAGLSQEGRDRAMKAYAKGRANIENYLQVKFQFWRSLPHTLCAVGHFDEQVARQNLRVAKAAYEAEPDPSKHHSLTKHMFSGIVGEQVQAFLEGTCRLDLPDLLREAAGLGFISCVERSTEGGKLYSKQRLS